MRRYISSFILTSIVYVVVAGLIFISFKNFDETKKSRANSNEKISLRYMEIKEKPVISKKVQKPVKIKKEQNRVVKPKKIKKQEVKKIVKKKEPIKKTIVKKRETKKVVNKAVEKKITEVKKEFKKQRPKKELFVKKSTSKVKKVHITQIKKKPIKTKYIETQKSYLSKNLLKIREEIKKALYYPNRARRFGLEDIVNIRFTLLNSGEVKDIQILSGHKFFKKSSIETIKEASKNFPKVQKELTIDLPIEYKLI